MRTGKRKTMIPAEVTIYGKVPPHNQKTEKKLLGVLLAEPKHLEDVTGILKAKECFYADAHQRIYGAIISLIDEKKPIDEITTAERLRANGELEQVGGAYFLTQLLDTVTSTAYAVHYAMELYQLFVRRELIKTGLNTASVAYDESNDVFDIQDEVERGFDELRKNGPAPKLIEPEDVMLADYLDAGNRAAKGDVTGVPSGIWCLDKKTLGWQPCEFTVMAARPAVGKSALATKFVRGALHAGYSPAVFTLEMSLLEYTRRIVSAESKVPLWVIQKGIMNSEQSDRVQAVIDWLIVLKKNGVKLIINDRPAMDYRELISLSGQYVRKKGAKIIFDDYLQLHTASDVNNREQQIAKISGAAKRIAKENNVPFIGLSQLSREVEKQNRLPMLSDLRESGAIEQDADQVFFLHNAGPTDAEGNNTENTGYLCGRKYRNGVTNYDLMYYFDKAIQDFTDFALGKFRNGSWSEDFTQPPPGGSWKPVEGGAKLFIEKD